MPTPNVPTLNVTTPDVETETGAEAAAIERLATAFHRCFDTFEVAPDVFAPDALFDLYPPFWRFQIQGLDASTQQLRSITSGPVTVEVLRMVPTVSGFVSETEEVVEGPEREVARHLWLCEVRDGRITEVVGYCNGGWDDALRARHAAEAPMIRP